MTKEDEFEAFIERELPKDALINGQTISEFMTLERQAKCLAYYLERELIKDIHSKYNISDKEVKEINKEAVNRAYKFLTKYEKDKESVKRFLLPQFIFVYDWDDPNK
jgi:myo-inositol-1-phosphate synthase